MYAQYYNKDGTSNISLLHGVLNTEIGTLGRGTLEVIVERLYSNKADCSV